MWTLAFGLMSDASGAAEPGRRQPVSSIQNIQVGPKDLPTPLRQVERAVDWPSGG
jgi:hypothetical protein